jgi:hypothetical protein
MTQLINRISRFAIGLLLLVCVAVLGPASRRHACGTPGIAARRILRSSAADNLGTARHLAVAANGDVYVALQNGGVRLCGTPPAKAALGQESSVVM